MSEEHKKNILDYITNSIEKGNENPEQNIKEIIVSEASEFKDFIPNSWKIDINGFISPNENTSGIAVIYGGYKETNTSTEAKGLIILIDENSKPIKTIYNYDNGTPLRYIQQMAQSEDGTFYMIDIDKWETILYQGGTRRFVMTNNFTLQDNNTGDYSVKLRTSYGLTGNYAKFDCAYLTKDPNSAHYVLIGYGVNNQNWGVIKVISLKVNVGSANEWETFSSTDGGTGTGGVKKGYQLGAAIVLFDSNSDYKIRAICSHDLLQDAHNIIKLEKDYSASSFTESVVYTNNSLYINIGSPYSIQRPVGCFKDYDNCYVINDNTKFLTSDIEYINREVGLYKINLSNNAVTNIYSWGLRERGDTSVHLGGIYTYNLNGDIYIMHSRIDDPFTQISAPLYYQRLENDNWKPLLVANDIFVKETTTFFCKSNFNYFQANMFNITEQRFIDNERYKNVLIKENYNPLNYNGEPYTNYNSVLPQQAEVYYNNSLVFARNLYNKTTNENQTNSTVVIPNTYLNNIDLSPQVLLSQTNTEIVTNTNPINKNIYETVFINFVNTINVINEDTNELYPNTASYINQNINIGTEANSRNTQVGLVKINTQMPTEKRIFWNKIDDTHKETEFAIQVKEFIQSIEFKSLDGLTTYLTIDTSGLETGKTYKISQKLRIE